MLALDISGDQLRCLFYDARETKGKASTKETRRRQTREDVSAYASLMMKEKKIERRRARYLSSTNSLHGTSPYETRRQA